MKKPEVGDVRVFMADGTDSTRYKWDRNRNGFRAEVRYITSDMIEDDEYKHFVLSNILPKAGEVMVLRCIDALDVNWCAFWEEVDDE